MLNKAVYLIKSKDTFAAIEHLLEEKNPVVVIKNFSELVRLLYWQEKDLHNVITMGRAAIQYGLSHDDDEVRKVAKAIAYNVASFTWPGWDEIGLRITPDQKAMGLDAAKVCVRLAKQLMQEDIAKSRARWILGAHYLAAGNVDQAKYNFYRASVYANRAGNPEEALLSWAFIYIAKRDWNELEVIKSRLDPMENGRPLIQQINTAMRVFGDAPVRVTE